jgi:hypothetical protein
MDQLTGRSLTDDIFVAKLRELLPRLQCGHEIGERLIADILGMESLRKLRNTEADVPIPENLVLAALGLDDAGVDVGAQRALAAFWRMVNEFGMPREVIYPRGPKKIVELIEATIKGCELLATEPGPRVTAHEKSALKAAGVYARRWLDFQQRGSATWAYAVDRKRDDDHIRTRTIWLSRKIQELYGQPLDGIVAALVTVGLDLDEPLEDQQVAQWRARSS